MKDIEKLYEIFCEYDTICTDTRNIVPDSIFFALKGEHFDANKFVPEALELGCAYAVSDDPANANIQGCIFVSDVLQTLQQLAMYHRSQLKIPVLAITGTNGKTTTKELVNTALSVKYKTHATKGNLNNHIGVPLTVLTIKSEHEFAIIEMGANHIGEIAQLCEIAQPTYGLITNIGKAHLEGFGSVDGVRKAKGELYDYLENTRGTVFYNSSDSILCEETGKRARLNIIPYGIDVNKAEITPDVYLALTLANPPVSIHTNLIGSYNANNVLAAIAVAMHFDLAVEEAAKAIEQWEPKSNRSQLLKTNSNSLIMDAYNANPSSMSVAITNFKSLPVSDEKMLILGDMLELGSDTVLEHKSIVNLLLSNKFTNVILVGKSFVQAANDTSFKIFETCNEAFEYLKINKVEKKTILLKGSRGIGLEKLMQVL